jgi:hypothetical protein
LQAAAKAERVCSSRRSGACPHQSDRDYKDGDGGLEGGRLVGVAHGLLDTPQPRLRRRRLAGAPRAGGEGVADLRALRGAVRLEVVGAAGVVAVLDGLHLQRVLESGVHGVGSPVAVLPHVNGRIGFGHSFIWETLRLVLVVGDWDIAYGRTSWQGACGNWISWQTFTEMKKILFQLPVLTNNDALNSLLPLNITLGTNEPELSSRSVSLNTWTDLSSDSGIESNTVLSPNRIKEIDSLFHVTLLFCQSLKQ